MRLYIFIIFLLVFLSSAYSIDNISPISNQMANSDYSGNYCQTVSLTPEQVQSLWDNYLIPGIRPDSIKYGNPAGSSKIGDTKGPKNQINTVDPNTGQGIAVDLPNSSEKVTNDNMQLKESCQGEYAYSLILQDTLRIGRCQLSNDTNMVCPVETNGLKYGNAEDNIDLVKKGLLSLVSDQTNKASDSKNSKQEDKSNIENINPKDLEVEGAPSAEYVKPVRKEGELITNHVKTSSFSAEFESVCTGQSASERCKVIILSYFDRYYNAYYSGIAVGTILGPTIIGVTKNALTTVRTNIYGSKVGDALESIGIGKVITRIKGLGETVYMNTVARDLTKYSGVIKGQVDDLLTSSLAGTVKGLDGVATKKTADATLEFAKTLDTLKKNPGGASEIYKLLGARGTYIDEARLAYKSASEAGLSAQAKLQILRNAEKEGVAVGDKAFLGDDAGKKLSKNFIKDAVGNDVPISARNLDDLATGFVGKDIYKIDFKEIGALRSFGDIKTRVDAGEELLVKLKSGSYDKVTAANYDAIKGTIDPNDLRIYSGSAVKVPLNPTEKTALLEEMQKNYEKFVAEKLEAASNNTKSFRASIEDAGLAPKLYANPLTQALNDPQLLWNKTTTGRIFVNSALPVLYWRMKTSDSPQLQSYFVAKDDYTNVLINQGQESIYNDAYIDIFSNKTIASGDYFAKVFNTVLSGVDVIIPSDWTQEAASIVGLVTRSDTKDIILYSSTKADCPNCRSSFKSVNGKAIVTTSNIKNVINYVLEYPDPKTYIDKGLSLILFSHHSNLNLESKDLKENINMSTAITNRETCIQKAQDLPVLGQIPYFTSTPSRIGAATGIVDSTSLYALGAIGLTAPGMAGFVIGTAGSLTISMLMNRAIASQLHGCVDSQDGYYVQYIYKAPDNTTPSDSSSLSDIISGGKQAVAAKATGVGEEFSNVNKDTFTKAMDSLKQSLLNTVEKKDKEFLQLKYETLGNSSSRVESNALFLTWFGPGSYCSSNTYDKESKITLSDGNHSVDIDKKAQTISVDGKVILNSPLVRTMTRNLRAGALEMAQSVTFVPAVGSSSFFELSNNGDIRVLDQSALSCISSGLNAQVGRTLSSDSLVPIMGKVSEISTTSGTKATPFNGYFEILGDIGQRDNYRGPLIVNTDVRIVVNGTAPEDLGELDSIIMDRGVILYDNEQRRFMVWARIMAEMNWDQIKGFKGNLVDTKNPVTNCDEVGVDFDVIPIDTDVKAVEDGQQMNSALDKAGPFQYFETPDKSFMFYSKLVDGQCKKYMKIVDKKTGQVLADSEIQSVEKTPDGFNVRTADGLNHSFGFSAENGRPILNYNGEKSPLLLAQGRNGSFYFDPNTGKWTVGNSQMLPLNDQFREKGELNVGGISKPGGNPVYQPGENLGKSGSFDIPLIDYNQRIWFVLLCSLFAFGIIMHRSKNK